jgi:uncharacterized protein (TIGR00159 family)
MSGALNWLSEIGVIAWVDMGLMAMLIYGLLAWIRKTRRAGLILGGISILGAVYLLSSYFGLVLTAAVLQGFFAIFLIVLVVIFQEELRQLFEHIAKWGLNRALRGRRTTPATLPQSETSVLVSALWELADERIGALVVIAGQDPLTRHVDGGIAVNGNLSEALIKSIFDPHSPGHDGAVVISRGRIEQLGVRLPLTKNEDALGPLGTRHAAALGLSDRTDALCLVVSEERGTVSVAHHGHLKVARDPAQLEKIVQTHCAAMISHPMAHPWKRMLFERGREKLAAIGIAALLWFALADRAQAVSDYFTVTVQLSAPPDGLAAVQMTPSAVEVRVAGTRRALGQLHPNQLRLDLPVSNARPGYQMLSVSEGMVRVPNGFEVTDLRPRQVFAVFEERPAGSREPETTSP